MPNNRTITAETMIILVILFAVIAFLVPNIFGLQNQPSTVVIQQNTGDTQSLTTGLETTVNDINQSEGYANITITDLNNGEIIQTTNLNESQSTTLELTEGNVTITYLQLISNSESTFEYEYPTYYGWPEGTPFLLQIAVSFIIWTFLLLLYYVIQGVD